jgi:hypothetical protein
VLSGAGFIGAVGDRVAIHFPRKSVFLFHHTHNPDTESRSQKGVSLKKFNVYGISKKEPLHNRHKVVNPFGTVICPK